MGRYFWVDAGIVVAVLAGFVVLGLWGDVAIGGLVVGVGLLAAGAALAARKAYERAREPSDRERSADEPTSEAPVAPEGLAQS